MMSQKIETKMDREANAKKAAGDFAAKYVKNGMKVGLGTGSTAYFLIEALGLRCRQEGLKISAVATSLGSEKLARSLGISILESDSVETLDLTIDGADQVDAQMNLIKGRGGALLREKILAQSSKEMIVIADETKVVNQLGNTLVPVEIAPFAYKTTLTRLKLKGYSGKMRLNSEGNFYLTDNNHYIVDLEFKGIITNPKATHEDLQLIAGVLETGLFFNVADQIVIGFNDGKVEIRK